MSVNHHYVFLFGSFAQLNDRKVFCLDVGRSTTLQCIMIRNLVVTKIVTDVFLFLFLLYRLNLCLL